MSTDRLPFMPIEEAVGQLKQSFNACLKIEKTFMERFRKEIEDKKQTGTEVPEETVSMPYLLSGMTLAATQHKFLFVEEWRYVLETEIDPNFDKAVAVLEEVEGSKLIDDFLKLYKPIRRNLLRSFECSLNARQASFCETVHSRAVQNVASMSSLPLHEGLSKAWLRLGASAVVIGRVEVSSEAWATDTQKAPLDATAAEMFICGAAAGTEQWR